MANYSIAISGLNAARKAIDVIGNNIANAATEGYHRQRVDLSPAYSSQQGGVFLGGGVDIKSVTRMIDTLLDQEILRQKSLLSQANQESATLSTIETALGEFSPDGGLNAMMDDYFLSLRDLSSHPDDIIYQGQAVSTAQALAGRFRTLGEFLTNLETQIKLEADSLADRVNTLTSQVADLNDNIRRVEIGGDQANNLRDQRDQCITQLAELVGVQTTLREYGVIDVTIGSMPVVTGSTSSEIEVGYDINSLMGITMAGAYCYDTSIQGGQLGGLIALKNQIVSDIHTDLDNLAATIMDQINQYHVQGVGSSGSFTELTGRVMSSEDLADFLPAVTDGKIYLRVTNTTTGVVTRTEIDVDVSEDSMTDIATRISNVTGVSASVASSRLNIQADANYKFDFIPAVLSVPTASNLTGANPPTVSVSGIYDGTTNQTFTFTALGTGTIGNGTLLIEVEDGDGATTKFNIGSGYVEGEELDLGNGIKVKLDLASGEGDINVGDTFEIDAFSDTDTSGFLASAGINTFFAGTNASDMAICSDIVDSPSRIAIYSGDISMEDADANGGNMAGLQDLQISGLDSLTPGEFYRKLVTDIGQDMSLKQMRKENLDVIVQNLKGQQSDISGVDINDEAAQLLIFEQMFQAMARYMNAIQSSIDSIMRLL